MDISFDGSAKRFRLSLLLMVFYVSFIAISMLGFLFFNNMHVSFEALALFTSFFILLILGVEIGKSLSFGKINKFKIDNLGIFLVIALFIQSTVILGIWTYIIDRYGSVSNILTIANEIRADTIGKTESIYPVWMSYIAGTIMVTFSLNLILFEYSKKKIIYAFTSIFSFIFILLYDLTSFGRVGTLYALFVLLGYLLFFRKKIFTLKRITLLLIVMILMFLPRYIRGENDAFSSTIVAFSAYTKTDFNPIILSVLTIYMYYFSSLFSMSSYYAEPQEALTYGERTFTPFYNIISRFVTSEERISLIDKMVYIPYPVNIYSIVKDLTSDFGYLGMILISLFFGIILGHIFRSQNRGIFVTALKIFMFGWIFYIPIYNAFSFGSFLLSFVILIFLSLFYDQRNTNKSGEKEETSWI